MKVICGLLLLLVFSCLAQGKLVMPLALHHHKAEEESISQSMGFPYQRFYDVGFSLGTPPQTFTFFLDTGASWTWVWADLCKLEDLEDNRCFV